MQSIHASLATTATRMLQAPDTCLDQLLMACTASHLRRAHRPRSRTVVKYVHLTLKHSAAAAFALQPP
eukprot:48907-Eustigmatos_ZCMA.PRE.1